MPWLNPRPLPAEAASTYAAFLKKLDRQLSDPATDRDDLCRDLLSRFLYGRPYFELSEAMPVVALTLDPRNVTLEAEYYAATDPEKFRRVKPLLWLWKNFDLTPAGQSVEFGVALRRVLARHIFKRVGRNFKCFQNVEFSVGYNLEVGDDVVIHRFAFVDDIGGVTLHDGASLSDFVSVYSHSHAALEPGDVTLRHTTIGRGVRVAYHATVLAGSTLSDDAMVGALSLVTHDVEPSRVAFGLPARAQREKLRPPGDTRGSTVDSRTYARPADRKGNPDFPEPTDPSTQTREV